jgi:HEAT repeat protein
VVEQLTSRIREGARKLEAAPSRPGDPRIAEYIAAVDLLAHHPSYEAANILLEQLFAGRATGLAARGLQGAITRSPNIALVDALLEAVETGTEPVAITRAAEILGWRRERAAIPHLQRLVQENKPINVRRAALMALGRLGATDTVDDIARALEAPQLAEDAAVALLLLGDRRGVDFHGQVLSRGENTKTGVAGEIVGKYGGPNYLLLLLAAIDRNRDECLGAIQALGYLGDPRAVAKLIEATGASSPRTRAVASHSLEILTGHAESIEEPQLRTRSERWWRENSANFNDGVRYRSGRMMAPALLIERLGDDDFTTRRASYDELVITSGINLPFDADGPWRVQLTHRQAWTEWWNAHRDSLPVGRWLFHGEIVG